MAPENDMKKELLKQMDKESDDTGQDDVKSLNELIARDRARIKRLKWATIVSWAVVALCFIAVAFLEHARGSLISSERVFLSSLAVIVRALLLIAVILTISLYLRSRTLTIRKIQARLANIEMLIKKMVENK